jgi:hypothetical protein
MSFPFDYISHRFYNKTDRNWYLSKAQFVSVPPIVKNYIGSKYCFFREVIYIDINGLFIGFGRSYFPFNMKSLILILKCINPFSPKLLGIVLNAMYSDGVKFQVIQKYHGEKKYLPYRTDACIYEGFYRVLSLKKNSSILVVTQEELLSEAKCG